NNTWGYDVGAASVVLEDFKAIPLPDGPPDTINSSSTPIEDDETIVTFGAKADMTQKVGVYSQIITFTAVTNWVPTPTITSISPTVASSGDTITITGTNFYGNGVSSAVSRVTIGGTSCMSFNVISSTTITCVLPLKDNGVYAVAVLTDMGPSNKNVTVEIANLTMQSVDATLCSSMTLDEVIYRFDARDGQMYRVKKMADGNCWMIDNLKYEPPTTGDVPFLETTSGYMTANGVNAPASAANWDVARWFDPSSAFACAGTVHVATDSTTRCGYFYNWYGVTYGTGSYNTTGQVNVAGSICPNNMNPGNTTSSPWKIPTAGPSGDYAWLNGKMAGLAGPTYASGSSLPPNWQPTGAWQGARGGWYRPNSHAGQAGGTGYYWSSTNFSNSQINFLMFSLTEVVPGINYLSQWLAESKNVGMPVRCFLTP
ncbi:IPT/TIG domain-containing protein, partial [Candidatus Saccharibacteria bacterium]|nr:IPT/TIG domain-containing protein [Candidatus Saccharibacteria bacterium]